MFLPPSRWIDILQMRRMSSTVLKNVLRDKFVPCNARTEVRFWPMLLRETDHLILISWHWLHKNASCGAGVGLDTASLVPVDLSRLCPRSPFQSFYAAGLRETASLHKFSVFKSKRIEASCWSSLEDALNATLMTCWSNLEDSLDAISKSCSSIVEDAPEGMLETCGSNLEVLEGGVIETSMLRWHVEVTWKTALMLY